MIYRSPIALQGLEDIRCIAHIMCPKDPKKYQQKKEKVCKKIGRTYIVTYKKHNRKWLQAKVIVRESKKKGVLLSFFFHISFYRVDQKSVGEK